ncbi:DUF5686 and carboxypeptidase-like regulatory domain-containing protein [Chitinophaga rhizophila]|uniref:DUF5686 and carboxypeptidase regulatory-like domain-containing protein n=1 Tax=Chitinophaga rhizophila TaxID=2866212 RepID=A0ABS7G9Z0_9BACT|nr:DUF5686 and carboxypeptidase-like regulatory domain-containing protein [Chitinophaga rhizophila]MBW8683624.1 DUF5686 and carboxypeptidase regulatory-like domain-containing protein [Chitinophaga rhizophila]
MNGSKNIGLGLLLLLTLGFSSVFAQTTRVKGLVTDKSGAPLPFVSVFVPGTAFGMVTDAAGRYELQFDSPKDSLRFSLMGYKAVTIRIKPGQEQVRNAVLESSAKTLSEFVVKRKKERYRNKDNPAVELIRLVIDNKSKNRMEHYDYANYNQYEKLEFALSNLSDKIRNSRFTRKYQFVFENQDTTKLEGRSLLPMYLEEKLADVYFRRDPEKKKTIIKADKKVSFENYIDNRGLSAYLNHIYQSVDIYDNNMMLFTNQFLSPIANAGPTFYRYYIADTITTADSSKLIVLEFYPRNKMDRLLEGKLYITLDGNYAIQKADMTANKEINLNFIRDFHLYMDFEKTPDGRYFMNKNTLMADFGLFKGSSGLYGERTVSIKDMVINKPMPEAFYAGSPVVENENETAKPDSFWMAHRHDTLTTAETKVYQNIDSLQNMKSFKRTMDIITFLLAGWKSVGTKFEVGPVNTFYNFNPVEGFRLRLGGRTTPKFSKSIYLEGYTAYGFKDQRWKYYFGGSYAFNHKSVYQWPVRAIKASYQHDTKIPGQELQFVQEDNFLLSFKRGNNDKWLYNDIFRLNYLHEFDNHSAFQLGFKHWRQSPAGTLSYYKGTGMADSVKRIATAELSLEVRWAPHEEFYQGKNFRIPIPNKYPIFTFRAIAGVKGLFNSGYNYQNISLNIYKMVYMSQLGYSEVVVEGGYIFGKVPYPLLTIHRANQTYAYQLQSYNLMNFLEFVSDRYAGINIDHNFNGFIFNKIPLLRKLKLREVAAVKVLYGGLSRDNDPRLDPSMIQFSKYTDGTPITYTLGKQPYIEGSVGIANIFKLLRLDLVKRFTYLDNPLISNWGIRGRVRFDF